MQTAADAAVTMDLPVAQVLIIGISHALATPGLGKLFKLSYCLQFVDKEPEAQESEVTPGHRSRKCQQIRIQILPGF